MSKSVYDIVTEAIIKQMEAGVIPWKKPWHTAGEVAISRSTGKAYHGINRFLLPFSGEYATFKQIEADGGKVNKGAHGFPVVFWKQTLIKELNPATGEEEVKKIPVLRYYTVFHVATQTDLTEKHPQTHTETEHDPISEAELIIESYIEREGICFSNAGGNEAYYMPATDSIVVPALKQFEHAEEYYSTTFHEMTHSTGHSSRLNRLNAKARFGSEVYSKEELVAEIGSASLMQIAGINTDSTFNNSVAYLQSWIKALKDDSKLIISASSKAEKAVKYILGEDTEAGEED